MKSRMFFIILLLIVLTACAPTASITIGPAPTSPAPSVVTLDVTSTSLRPYPDSVVLKQEGNGKKSKTEFRSSAVLPAVYAHYHSQLEGSGWRRTSYDMKPSNKVEAAYVRGNDTLTLKLNREGSSGRYKLEIDG